MSMMMASRRSWMLLLCAIVMVSSETVPQNLFDLKVDPSEMKNMLEDSDQSEALSYFTDRISYWNDNLRNPEVPDPTTRESGWANLGGVGPWLTKDYENDEISQIYDTSSSPHIVFVMIDDWGWNDFGLRSTYLSWTTPHIDNLAREGVSLENYFTYQTCAPSRGAFMTGRYSLRLGMWETHDQAELPLLETTLAEEMKSAGYRTYLVGKWHLGTSTPQHLPTSRGFDYFYGYLSGYIDYWSKTYNGHIDLYENDQLLREDDEALDSTLHTSYLFQSKVEDVIKSHVNDYPNDPMFLFYALQLIHAPWSAPEVYLSRCQYPTGFDSKSVADAEYNVCGMNLMLDEAIANLTCSLNTHGLAENTIMILASDNGGEGTISGNSYPFKGHKGSYYRGGVSATAIVHSKMLPTSRRGTTYDGLVHVTDWLPTLMHLASNGEWTGSYSDAELDGVNVWDSILSGEDSPREEIVHFVNGDNAVIQRKNLKYFYGQPINHVDSPQFVFTRDLSPESAQISCDTPSLLVQLRTENVFAQVNVLVYVTGVIFVIIAAINVVIVLRRRSFGKKAEEKLLYPSAEDTHPLVYQAQRL